MQYTTTGSVTDAGGTSAHTVVHTVTGLTKVVDGIKTLVMWDRDYSDGELSESELAFFAQSDKGDVWFFGEYPEEYENGTFIGAPSTFISGIQRAQAGIAMQAEPHRNTPAYVQAYAPKVDFLDCGDVLYKNLRVCVPTGCYNDVMVIDEFNPLDPPSAGHQRKYYSPGTGLVKVTASGGDSQEFMDLAKIKKLTGPNWSTSTPRRSSWTGAATASARTSMQRRRPPWSRIRVPAPDGRGTAADAGPRPRPDTEELRSAWLTGALLWCG